MSKNQSKSSFFSIISINLFLFLILTVPVIGASMPYINWGASSSTIAQVLPATVQTQIFKPSEKPDYDNKLVKFILSLNANNDKHILILRAKTKPLRDYIFFNDKLYAAKENWGTVDNRIIKRLKRKLSRKFGKPSVVKDGKLITYSFSFKNTKVVLYHKKKSDLKADCIVYFYTKKLFRMMILENFN